MKIEGSISGKEILSSLLDEIERGRKAITVLKKLYEYNHIDFSTFDKDKHNCFAMVSWEAKAMIKQIINEEE